MSGVCAHVTTLPPAILVAHADAAELRGLAQALEPLGQPIVTASSTEEALAHARVRKVSAAVVAAQLGASSGTALVARLRRDGQPELPVIFVGRQQPGRTLWRKLTDLGSADFTLLPVPPEALRSKVAVLSELSRLRQLTTPSRADGPVPEMAGFPIASMRLLTQATSDYALFFLDASAHITEWTVSAEALFGYSRQEAEGRHGELIFTPEDRTLGAPAAEISEARRSGQALDNRIHVRKDGSRFPTTGRLIALREPATGVLRGFAKIVWDATQLRLLEENERKFREIFETANEGIWMLDARGNVQAVNQRMAEMVGYTIDEIVGQPKFALTLPEDKAYVQKLFQERKTGQLASSVDMRFRRKDGMVIRTLMSSRPMFREGEFAGALDMFTDVTERVVAESRFRLFFESSAAGHALVDPNTRRFIAVNRRMAEIAGRSQEDLLRLTFTEITHPEDREQDRRIFSALWSGEATEVSAEKRYVRPDGSVVWIHLTSTVVRDPYGHPELQLSVVQDITARKQLDLELEENRTRLRLAIEAADLGVFYHDALTRRDTWNDQARRLLGLGPHDEPSYETFLRHVHPDDHEAVQRTLAPVFQPEVHTREFDLQCRVLRPDGDMRYIAVNGVTEPRQDDSGQTRNHIVGTVRDITAAKEFELELQQKVEGRTRELQEKTNQLESFCYTVAHDLRAPLRAINGYADFVAEDFETMNRAGLLEHIERIKGSTRRLDQLIRDLLDYSRMTEAGLSIERVDLGSALGEALGELENEIKRRGAVVAVPAELPTVWAEQATLEQILVNLISNAVKFARPGEAPRVEVSIEERGHVYRLSVQDYGIGIPKEYHERIFRVFERLQSARNIPGTGIGLAIVAKAMQRLGGKYGVESTPGHGSTFWIELRSANT